MMTLHGLLPSLARDIAGAGPSCAAILFNVVSREKPPETPPASSDTRDIDDPARLVEEARSQREKMAAELRAATLAIAIEPAATYRP